MKPIGFILFAAILAIFGLHGISGNIVHQKEALIEIIATNIEVYTTDIIIADAYRIFETSTNDNIRINELRIACNQIDGYCPVNRWNVAAFGTCDPPIISISSQGLRYIRFTYWDTYGAEKKTYAAYNECDTFP